MLSGAAAESAAGTAAEGTAAAELATSTAAAEGCLEPPKLSLKKEKEKKTPTFKSVPDGAEVYVYKYFKYIKSVKI